MRRRPRRSAMRRPLAALALSLALALAARADRNEAGDALVRTFTLQGVTAAQPLRPDGAGYDWDWRGPRDDPEWAWFFNRHHWFPALAEAYSKTGDIRYRDALLDTLDDWIKTHPAPGSVTFSSAWRPLEAARRLQNSWLPISPVIAAWPEFTAERRARFEASLAAHGEHLMRRHAFGGNHLVTEMLVLARLALDRPDLPGAPAWLDYSLAKLDAAYADQVYPDGAHIELSTHYQRVIALNYQELLDLLRRHGRAELAASWAPRVETLWRYVAAVMTPDGGNPLNNDSDEEDYRGLLAKHAPHLLNAAPATVHLPWAGQTVFRGGEDARHWAFFEAGPRGTDHEHADHLQLSISVGENQFLTDPGRYTYQPGPWRDYFAGPTGHNVLLLDGRGSDPRPRRVSAPPEPARFIRAGGLEIAWGDAMFSTDANARAADWRRVVVHAPAAGWVVIDRVVAFGEHTLATQWHWGSSVEVAPAGATFTARAGSAELRVASPADGEWSVARGALPPDVRGWFSRRFNQREAAPQTDLVQTLRGPRVNIWIFQPADIATPLAARSLDAHRVRIETASGHHDLDLRKPELVSW